MSKQVIASKSSVGKSHIFALDGTASLSALSTSAQGVKQHVVHAYLFQSPYAFYQIPKGH